MSGDEKLLQDYTLYSPRRTPESEGGRAGREVRAGAEMGRGAGMQASKHTERGLTVVARLDSTV